MNDDGWCQAESYQDSGNILERLVSRIRQAVQNKMASTNAQNARQEEQDVIAAQTMTTKNFFYELARSIVLLILAAAASSASQLTLTPAFGAVPSNMGWSIASSFALGIFISKGDGYLSGLSKLVPLAVAWMPAIQSKLMPYTATWGPVRGPMLNSMLTVAHIVVFTAYDIPVSLARGGLRKTMRQSRASKMFFLAMNLFMFLSCENATTPAVAKLLANFGFLMPVHLWLILGLAYSLMFPSWLLVFATPAVLHVQFMDPHFSHAAVDASLRPHNWTLLERQWSNTGYISVLDSFDVQYRVMRCDHSLLGGEWLLTDDRKHKEGWKTSEPIYAVFQMLEAVRLMELEPIVPDSEAQALVIGLGIGTAPKALVAHGIQTTVVELDPVVHDLATRYFDLPTNHTAVIQDAVSWVQDEATLDKKKYDYIIHDVFTGGTEPLSLFTSNFLSNLRCLLTPNGVIAINYAGDLTIPLTTLVLTTINTVFSHNCKIFRDAPPEKDALDDEDSDFLNMVVFCRNSPGEITFRKPRPADFLGSKSRQYYMLPKPEHELAFPQTSDAGREDGQHALLQLGDEGEFDAEQGRSAARHWRIMRKVLPDAVWDNW